MYLMKDETILEWQSPEHHFDRKNNEWYWGLGIGAIGIAVLCFYFNNFLFGIFIIISAFTIGLLSYKETRAVNVKITHRGIVVGRQLYEWSSYQDFWIEDEHTNGARILLRPMSDWLPLTTIHINENIDLNELREILLEFLEEDFIKETILHDWFHKIIAR